jgi:hypothetical protein
MTHCEAADAPEQGGRRRARVVEKPFVPAQILAAIARVTGDGEGAEVSRSTPRA